MWAKRWLGSGSCPALRWVSTLPATLPVLIPRRAGREGILVAAWVLVWVQGRRAQSQMTCWGQGGHSMPGPTNDLVQLWVVNEVGPVSVDERTESKAIFPAARQSRLGGTGTRVNGEAVAAAARGCPWSYVGLEFGTQSPRYLPCSPTQWRCGPFPGNTHLSPGVCRGLPPPY